MNSSIYTCKLSTAQVFDGLPARFNECSDLMVRSFICEIYEITGNFLHENGVLRSFSASLSNWILCTLFLRTHTFLRAVSIVLTYVGLHSVRQSHDTGTITKAFPSPLLGPKESVSQPDNGISTLASTYSSDLNAGFIECHILVLD